MTPERLSECLALLHWPRRTLSKRTGYAQTQVERWAKGAPIPEPVAAWLERAARWMERNPPPGR